MAGLSPAGLEVKRAADVRADLEAGIQGPSGLGAGASVRPDGPLGLLLGILSTSIGLCWEALEQVYDALDPDAATSDALDNVAALVGVTRLQATHSSGTITATGTPATVIPAGSIVRVPNGARVLTLEEQTIPGGGSVDILAETEDAGAIAIGAGAISEIVTVISGWSSVINADAFTTGRDLETDAALRVRRETSLQVVGAATEQAIKARLEALEDVLTVIVVSNRKMTTDGNGLPPKSYEAVIHPSTVSTDVIAEALWLYQPAGITSYGIDAAVDVTDSQGFIQRVNWSWAAIQDVHVVIVLTYTSSYPADGDDQVADAIVAVGESYDVGDDVVILQLLCAAADIPGVRTAIARALVGSTPGAGDTVDIELTYRQIAQIQLGNVDIISTPA